MTAACDLSASWRAEGNAIAEGDAIHASRPRPVTGMACVGAACLAMTMGTGSPYRRLV